MQRIKTVHITPKIELFNIHVAIRGHEVGVFKRKSFDDIVTEKESAEFFRLGLYLSDVMNVEEEYPYDLFCRWITS